MNLPGPFRAAARPPLGPPSFALRRRAPQPRTAATFFTASLPGVYTDPTGERRLEGIMIRCSALFLLAAVLLAPLPSQAMPLVSDFSHGPVVFDFEDGLAGWKLEDSAPRVTTQVLGGKWVIFTEGSPDRSA